MIDPDRGVVFRFDKPRFGKTHRLCSHELGWLAVQNAAHIRGRISNTGGGRRRPAHAPPPLAASESRYKAPSRGSRAAVCSCQAGHRRGRSRHSRFDDERGGFGDARPSTAPTRAPPLAPRAHLPGRRSPGLLCSPSVRERKRSPSTRLATKRASTARRPARPPHRRRTRPTSRRPAALWGHLLENACRTPP